MDCSMSRFACSRRPWRPNGSTAKQSLHVRLDEALRLCLDLSHAAVRRVRAEQLQARHLPLLDSEITNADEVRGCFRERLRRREDSVRRCVRPSRRALVSPGHGESTIPPCVPRDTADSARKLRLRRSAPIAQRMEHAPSKRLL
jgi:hypothetical protein